MKIGSFRCYWFRWHRHWQWDFHFREGWYCVGVKWVRRIRPVAYWSPDATPSHELAKGWRSFQ